MLPPHILIPNPSPPIRTPLASSPKDALEIVFKLGFSGPKFGTTGGELMVRKAPPRLMSFLHPSGLPPLPPFFVAFVQPVDQTLTPPVVSFGPFFL